MVVTLQALCHRHDHEYVVPFLMCIVIIGCTSEHKGDFIFFFFFLHSEPPSEYLAGSVGGLKTTATLIGQKIVIGHRFIVILWF